MGRGGARCPGSSAGAALPRLIFAQSALMASSHLHLPVELTFGRAQSSAKDARILRLTMGPCSVRILFLLSSLRFWCLPLLCPDLFSSFCLLVCYPPTSLHPCSLPPWLFISFCICLLQPSSHPAPNLQSWSHSLPGSPIFVFPSLLLSLHWVHSSPPSSTSHSLCLPLLPFHMGNHQDRLSPV